MSPREGLFVRPGLVLPEDELREDATRAGGPGGQTVNKVATRIDLRVGLEAIEGLSEAARTRLRVLARRRTDAEGRLVVTSQATRNQARNLEDARARVADLIRAALVAPRARVKTGPSAGARRRRLAGKKQRAEVKRWRRRPAADD